MINVRLVPNAIFTIYSAAAGLDLFGCTLNVEGATSNSTVGAHMRYTYPMTSHTLQ